jgi:hypothetical protein
VRKSDLEKFKSNFFFLSLQFLRLSPSGLIVTSSEACRSCLMPARNGRGDLLVLGPLLLSCSVGKVLAPGSRVWDSSAPTTSGLVGFRSGEM